VRGKIKSISTWSINVRKKVVSISVTVLQDGDTLP
jgi:hypothetical protein